MYHTIDTAEVNECAEACEGLDLAGVCCADFSCLPELSLGFFLLCILDSLDRTNSSLSALCNFDYSEFNLLLEELLKLCASGETSLRSGDEYSYAENAESNALVNNVLYNALENSAFFLSLENLLIASLLVHLSLGKSAGTLGIVNLDNNELDLVANAYDVSRLLGGVVCTSSKYLFK